MIGLFTERQKKDKDQGTNNELNPVDRAENLLEFYFQSSLFFGTMPPINTNFNFNYRGKYANRKSKIL